MRENNRAREKKRRMKEMELTRNPLVGMDNEDAIELAAAVAEENKPRRCKERGSIEII